MIEPDEHERILELLRRARRPPEEITPEHLEENLRWLLELAAPPAQASDSLRERVEATAAAHREARPPALERRTWPAFPVPGRLLAGALSLAAAVALSLLLTTRAPAQMLARTLAAMALVRSAHCTGWYVNYRARAAVAESGPERMNVEWWYKAPDRFREEAAERERTDGNMFPIQLVVRGQENALTARLPAAGLKSRALPPRDLAQYLTPLDFFSREGFLRRAQAEKADRSTEKEAMYEGRPVQVIEVHMTQQQPAGPTRNQWVLYVDPASDRVLRSEARFDRQERDGSWRPVEAEVLDHFDYDVPIPDHLFEIKTPARPLRRDHS